MKSAGNGDILNGGLQVLHVHVLFVAPLGAGHMAQTGTDQWSDTLKPHTQGDIIKHRKGVADGTEIRRGI